MTRRREESVRRNVYNEIMSKKFILIASAVLVLVAVGGAVALHGSHLASVQAATPEQIQANLHEGDRITANNSDKDPDIYIVNQNGYMRLFLNPTIASFYGHLGKWPFPFLTNTKQVSAAVRDSFTYSGLLRDCENNDQKVYAYEFTGEDTGVLHWVNMTAAQALSEDPNFALKIFCINNAEFNWFSKSGMDYTHLSQVMMYHRGAFVVTPAPVAGNLNLSLAIDSPAARTVTTNAQGVEFLKFNVSGTGTINQFVFKRSGPGSVDDFDNVYIYEGARRLTTGKSITSSTGEVTFSALNWAVSGTRTFTLVGDLSATAGNVDYFTLSGMTLAAGTVGGLPISGNNVTISGATSGTITMSKVGSLGSPNAGQAQAQISEFKLAANTEAASVKRIQMIQGGTMSTSNFANLKLKVSTGTQEWPGTIDGAGYIVFDMGSGFTIAKGANTVFKVYSDVNGKKDDTIKVYFEYSSDILGIGDQFGFGMAATITDMDTVGEAHSLTLAGGVLTISTGTLSATDVGTSTDDTVFARLTYAAATNIEIRKTRIDLSLDLAGDGTWDDLGTASVSSGFSDLDDIKMVSEDTNQVLVGPSDGNGFTTDDTDGNPSGTSAAQKAFTDTINLNAGQTLRAKITADLKTSNTRTGTDIETSSKVAIGIDDYSDNTGVTELKYSGTNTALATTDIVPNANINGPAFTVRASNITLSLAATPADQTVVKGRQGIDVVGIVFAATNASPIKVTAITVTGYSDANGAGAFDKGSAGDIASTVQDVALVEKESGTVISSGASITNNLTAAAGTVAFSNLNWNIPAGGSKTLLVRVNLLNLTVPAKNHVGFDIAATTDVTGVDNNSSTINAGNATPNGATSITTDTTVTNSGSITLAAINDGEVQKQALYWGQTGAKTSKFRLTGTNEGQFLERFTVAASVAAEVTDAKANVQTVKVTYKNKNGDTLTSSGAFSNGASVNFGWSCGNGCTSGTATDTRPYVPKDSSLDITVAADLKTKADGATTSTDSGTATNAVFFSLDLMDRFNGSSADGFRAVGDGSGAVIDGDSSNIVDVAGSNNMYIYRVFPKFDQVALAAPYNLIGTPTIFKFTVTAMGLSDSRIFFDNAATGSGSIKFEVIASGEYNQGAASTAFSIYDSTNTLIDNSTLTADANPATHASLTFDFTSLDAEIAGGQSQTFTVQLTNPNTSYSKTKDTGRSADYFQLTLLDDENGLINWVSNTTGSTNDLDTPSTTGVLKNLPMYGPTFQR